MKYTKNDLVLKLLLDGYSKREIAKKLKCNIQLIKSIELNDMDSMDI